MNKDVFLNFPTIETDRLMLRTLYRTDADAIYEILSHEGAMAYYGIFPIESIDIATWFVDQYRSGFRSETILRWAIIEKSTDTLIGTCGFQGISESASRAEIGYELHPDFWHNGYMYEALLAIIKWGFDVFDLNRVEAFIYPENIPSENVVKHLGFNFEGCLKEYAYFRNQFTDLNLFSLLKREFYHK